MDVTVWLYQVCLRIVHPHSTEVKSKDSAVIGDLLWEKPLLCCRDLSNLRWTQLITIYKLIHSTFFCIGENCAKQCKSIWHFKQTHGATSLEPHTTHSAISPLGQLTRQGEQTGIAKAWKSLKQCEAKHSIEKILYKHAQQLGKLLLRFWS